MSIQEQWEVVWFTARMASLATLIIIPPGIALGWLLARFQFPGKSIAETIVALPLVLPPVATGFLLLEILSASGWLGSTWRALTGEALVFTWRAVVIALAVMSLPLLARSARIAFEQVDPRLEGVARSLGAGAGEVFWRVTLPLAWRGVLAGTLLAFARALGEFGATIVVAGNIPGETATLSLSIYHFLQLGQDETAMSLLLFSVLLAFAAVIISERLMPHSLNRRRPVVTRSERP